MESTAGSEHLHPRIGARFKPGDRVRFQYGTREMEGTVTSASGGRVHVAIDFSDEQVPGLFREGELRSA